VVLKLLESVLRVDVPLKGLVFFSEVGEWLDYSGVVGDESSVEVGEAKEALDFRNVC